MHVDAERERRISFGEPARRDEHVVYGLHAHPAVRLRHGRVQVPRRLQFREVLEREVALPIVLGRARREVGGVDLGQRDQPSACFRLGLQLVCHLDVSF